MINEKNTYRGKVLGLVVLLMSLGLTGATFEKAAAAEQPIHDEKTVVAEQTTAANGPYAFAGSEGMTVEQLVEDLATDIDAFWYEQMSASGYDYPAPGLQLVYDEPIDSACGPMDETTGPAYCPLDETVYYPVNFVDPVTGLYLDEIGDFAVATVLAHEMGHHVQNHLGTFEAEQNGQLLRIDIELQADCFAGVWANSAYYEGELGEGDFQEALTIASVSGDLRGVPVDDPGAHGTSQERIQAFMIGYNSGDASQCVF